MHSLYVHEDLDVYMCVPCAMCDYDPYGGVMFAHLHPAKFPRHISYVCTWESVRVHESSPRRSAVARRRWLLTLTTEPSSI